jgi:RNA polymerase sigma factor (sigma-70 family)
LSALRSGQLAPIHSDNGLVAAVRRGDDRAFGELYSRYGRRIVSYVFGMLGDHGRAEDVAQEVFISALRRMRATERPIAFKPWIYEIARNACIDEFRRTRRAQEVPLDSSDEPERPDRRLESRMGSPDAAFERRQQLDDLRGAFRGLSESHHKIIVLRELEGLSYTEIGRRLGMTRPVVESTLFRARRRLGAEYEEIASGRRCEQVQTVIDTGGEKALRALGIRERRRVARHVSHCQPCRRYAHLAGVDDSILKGPGLVEKIAALLPIPAFLRWRRGGSDSQAAASGSHSAAILQWAPRAAQFADPASPAIGFGRTTAAVVAAAALAGGGVAGTLSTVGGGGKHPNRVGVVHLSSVASGGAAPPARVAPRPAASGQPKAAPVTSGPSTGGTGGSGAPSEAQPTSSSAPSSGSSATESHTAQTPASSLQAPSTSQASPPQSSQGQPQSSGGLPQLPQLPQLPIGQSGSNLPQLPQINLPQLPQLPQLPSLKQVIGTVRKLLP